MDRFEWAESHNELNDDSNESVGNITVDIEINPYVAYFISGEVKLYNNIPCEAFVNEVVRVEYDEDGTFVDEEYLAFKDFPSEIVKAAKKKMIEGWA
jgi:hypothetical protein